MIVLEHQSIFDLAVICAGSAEAAYELAVVNGLNVTDDLQAGDFLDIVDVINADIAAYYKNKGIQPATALIEAAERVVMAADVIIRDENVLQGNFIPVLENQSFFDLAIQECGSAEAAYQLAEVNGYDVTDMPATGTKLMRIAALKTMVVAFYKQKGLYPASGIIETIDTDYRTFDFTFDFTFY